MGKRDPRFTPAQIKRLLYNPYKDSNENRLKPEEISQTCQSFRSKQKDYDSLYAEELVSLFAHFLRAVIARYEENKQMVEEAEAQENDLRHCMELTEGLTEKEKRMIYRRLTEALRLRRFCKTENEILYPLYNEIHDKALITKLNRIHDQISGTKDLVNSRVYRCRTSVLDDFRAEKDEKVSPAV